MVVSGYEWVADVSWTFTDKDIYEEAWENGRGDMLYVEDILAGRSQPDLTEFTEPRYRVCLQKQYRPADEPESIDEFTDEHEAAALIRNLTYPG